MDPVGRLVTSYFEAVAALAPRAFPERGTLPPESRTLAEEGLVVLPGLIPAAEIQAINRVNARYFDLSHPSKLAYSPDGKALLEGALASDDELRRFYFLHIKYYPSVTRAWRGILDRIAPILRGYYRSRFYVRDVYCYRTQPVPAAQGSYAWHTDNYPTGCLKVMTYLTDVTPEHGTFTFARKSHLGYRPSLGRIGDRYKAEDVLSRYETVDCVGGPGTVIIFHNNAAHRATDPRREHRDVINFTVLPSLLQRSADEPAGLDLEQEKSFLKRYTR